MTAAGIEEAGGGHEAPQQADSEAARARIETGDTTIFRQGTRSHDLNVLQGLS
jgi:hypothetical protein